MKPETKQCQNCKKDFTIESEDFSFYEKMGVLPPDLCPECGMGRLMSLRNERIVYWRDCAKCKNKTMSLYHKDAPYVVYCHDCWWGDGWEGLDYGVKYDPSKSLMEQMNALQKIVPRESVIILNSTNCDYGNNIRDSKNCYFCFLVSGSENLLYSMWIVDSKDCMEDHKVVKSELVVHSVDVANSYKSAFLKDSSDCSFCYFSYDLKGCNNCLFSSNLRSKSYYVRNKQVTKEGYEEEYKRIFDGSFETFSKSFKEYENLIEKSLHKFAFFLKSSNSVGNYLQNCDRNNWCFDGVENQDVKYVASILHSKNTYSSYSIGVQPTENIFGSCVVKGGSMIKNSFNLFNSSFCSFSDSLVSSDNCIACVGLKKKQYCILNKQYSKEEYQNIEKIIKEKRELSSIVPSSFSTFAYNETAAQDYYPLNKYEALKLNYDWQDDIPMTKGKETVLWKNIPDNIKDIGDDILNEVLACLTCKRNYKIVQNEMRYLREFNLPLPRECPQCRMSSRREIRLPFKLYHRSCMCNKENHSNHKGKCDIQFETSYAPERPEVVYCEKCYQHEVY
jgi:hypothetical protein